MITPELRTLESEIETELNSLTELDNATKKEKNEDIKRMVNYYNDLTSAVEDRRNKLYDSALQLVAILLTIIGILFAARKDLDEWFYLILPVILVQLIASIIIIMIYEIQSKFRYPFLKLGKHGNQWKWFYYGNPYIQQISTSVIWPQRNVTNAQALYLQGLRMFVGNYVEETLERELNQNVVQLYLLQVHNYYKNQFYLCLTRVRTYSYLFSIVAVIIGAILAFTMN